MFALIISAICAGISKKKKTVLIERVREIDGSRFVNRPSSFLRGMRAALDKIKIKVVVIQL